MKWFKKKTEHKESDFILGDKDIRQFNSVKKSSGREVKRLAKIESMRVKAKKIREKNVAHKELEDARSVRDNIKRKSFDRKVAKFQRGVNIIKKVKKKRKGYVSNSPFAPEKWK